MEIQWPLILFTFFNCLAGGIFLTQGVLTLKGKGQKMQVVSCVSAIIALAIGGLSVFFHLQHPLRMLNGFGHITSGITIELIFVVLFGIAVVLYFLMAHRAEDGVAPKWCAVLAIVVSVALPFATGDSYLMESIPVWDTFLLPVYYVVATVMLGGLASLIIAAILKDTESYKICAVLALAGSGVTALVSVIYAFAISGMTDLYTDMEYYFDPTLPDVAMRQAADITSEIVAGDLALAFWLGTVIVGGIAPAALSFLLVNGKVAAERVMAISIVAFICAVVGTLVWRVLLYEVAVNALIQFQWALN